MIRLDFTQTSPVGPPWLGAPPTFRDVDGDGAADLLVQVRDTDGGLAKHGVFALYLGGERPTTILTAADADVLFVGNYPTQAFKHCVIGPDLDGGGMLDILCVAEDGRAYIHLVEDTDLDGDLWSVLDCDADDNDPLVH